MRLSVLTRRSFIYTSIFLSLSACVQKRNFEHNVVVAQILGDPPSLHPCNASSEPALYVFEYTQRTLTRTDMRSFKQIPLLTTGLAEMSKDSLEYTYTLRDDVKWDDGSPLTTADVVFSVKAAKCPLTDNPEEKGLYDNIQDIRVKDARTFTMVAKSIYFHNPDIFNDLVILEKKTWDPKAVFDKVPIPAMNDTAFKAEPYSGLQAWEEEFNKGENGHEPAKLGGLGPYKLVSWTAGSAIVLVKKQNWWGANDTIVYNHADPDTIIFKAIVEDAAVSLALKKQELDVVTTIGSKAFNDLKQDANFTKNYTTGVTEKYGYNYLALNTKPEGKHQPLFSDVRVRRAMAYLMPIDEIIKTIANGYGTRQASYLQPANGPYYNDTLKLIPFDIDKAKTLLADAGWRDTDGDQILDKTIKGKKVPFRFTFTYRASEPNKQIALMMKDAFYKAGIDMIADPEDGNVVIQRLMAHDFDAAMSAWSASAIPDDPAQIFYSTNWANHGYNFTGFGDRYSDSLIDASNRAVSVPERIRALKLLQAKIYQDQPYVFTYSVKRKIAISSRFNNPGMYAERPGVMLNALKGK
jgi:peptide/nickel transport system substrate-binding protein